MEKLKYIKIEHEDGTLSENVPIGADASNVDTSDGNNVEIKINNLINTSTMIENTANLANTIAQSAYNATTVLNSKLDNLAHLEEGSTTGDAELIDIRTNNRGHIFDSAGDAIRDSINNINNKFDNLLGYQNYSVALHMWLFTSETEAPHEGSSNKYARLINPIHLEKGSTITIADGVRISYIYLADETGEYYNHEDDLITETFTIRYSGLYYISIAFTPAVTLNENNIHILYDAITIRSKENSIINNINTSINDINNKLTYVKYISYSKFTSNIQNYTVHRETGCKSAYYYPEKGETYKITAMGHNRFKILAFKDKIEEFTEPFYTADILLYDNNDDNSFTFTNIDNFQTIFIYLTNDSTNYIPTVTIDKAIGINDNLGLLTDKNIYYRMYEASWTGNNSNKIEYEENCLTYVFNAEEFVHYTIEAENEQHNRFKIFGSIDKLDIISTLPDEGISNIELIYDNNDDNNYNFINTKYQTIFVYLVASNSSLRPQLSVIADISYIYDKYNEDNISSLFTLGAYLSKPTSNFINNSLKEKTIEDLYEIYETLCTNYPDVIRLDSVLGMDSSNEYELRTYEISLHDPKILTGEVTLSGDMDPNLPNSWTSDLNNPIILINTGCHGNEKAPTWGTALAIKELVESQTEGALYIKSNYIIKVLVCMNPYGFANNNRRNSNNQDLNRDCTNFTQTETIAWKSWVDANKANTIFYLDAHGTSGYYAYWEALDTDPNFNVYSKNCMKFTTMIQTNWKEYLKLYKPPYCYMCKSTYTGMTMNYTLSQGIPGHILETPQDFYHGASGGWGNDLYCCKITKDLILNTILLYDKVNW